MNWFRQNKFLGGFLIVLLLLTGGAIYFLITSISAFDDASARFDQTAGELNKLQHLTPAPSEQNFQKLKTVATDYEAAVNGLKGSLKACEVPAEPMAPNEFQSRLRQSVTAAIARARAAKVKLPDNFYLGFDDFASSLPTTAAAPLLGQQLKAVEIIVNTVIDAHVDAITGFSRTPLPEERGTAAPVPNAHGPGPHNQGRQNAGGGKIIERHPINIAFAGTAQSARKVINQLASSKQQFFIVRTLNIHDDKDKGPPREQPADATAAAAGPAPATGGASPAPAVAAAGPSPTPAAAAANGATASTTSGAPASALNFIVGTERVDVAANIGIIKFNF